MQKTGFAYIISPYNEPTYLLNNLGKETLKVLKTFRVWQGRPNFLRRYEPTL
jgi:hypothetical protein